jgi:hypothetical protein
MQLKWMPYSHGYFNLPTVISAGNLATRQNLLSLRHRTDRHTGTLGKPARLREGRRRNPVASMQFTTLDRELFVDGFQAVHNPSLQILFAAQANAGQDEVDHRMIGWATTSQPIFGVYGGGGGGR